MCSFKIRLCFNLYLQGPSFFYQTSNETARNLSKFNLIYKFFFQKYSIKFLSSPPALIT